MQRVVDLGILIAAALLEVGGDAIIRVGLRGRGTLLVALGFVVLGAYGIVVNLLAIDFSRLLAGYVAVFALVSVAFGRFVFGETVALSTWIGVAVILAGGAIIQFGATR